MDLSDWEDAYKGIKRTKITAAAGDNTIVSAVAGRRIVVVQCYLFVNTDCTIRFEDGAGGPALTGFSYFTAKTANVLLLPFSLSGWFETSVNTLLNLEVSAGNVGGVIGYIEE